MEHEITDLPNPFTPSRIANKPEDFHGRENELKEVTRVIRQGSIIVDGPIGIGKSSLLSQLILKLEAARTNGAAFATVHSMICHKSINTPEELAFRMLGHFSKVNETTWKSKFSLKFFEMEKTSTHKQVDAARAMRTICDFLSELARQQPGYIVIVLDEADKAPAAVAQFMRVVLTTTELEQSGGDRIRFIVSGISPFYDAMIQTDAGVSRFVYSRYSLPPFDTEDAESFLEEKLELVLSSEGARRRKLVLHEELVPLVARVTGGHPHLLQLVGSYMLDHEEGDPDNLLDSRDLVGCFHRICFEARGPVYEKMIHQIALEGHLEDLKALFYAADERCPTSISLKRATEVAEEEGRKYLLHTGTFSFDLASSAYRLNDEFLRIHMLLKDPDQNADELEKGLLQVTPRFRLSQGDGRRSKHGDSTYSVKGLSYTQNFEIAEEGEDDDEDDSKKKKGR